MVTLTDLDSITEQVRNIHSREYINEAIVNYRSGAYRTAIIATWLALTFDIIEKIRELAERGDATAIVHTLALDNAIKNKNIPRMQSIEESILKVGYQDFDFVNDQEYIELKRLKNDRNLCAHPAFTNQNVLYQPSPELVRGHIVHCIQSVLIHQPVHGKSAIEEFRHDLTLDSFPSDYGRIKSYIVPKYLNRTKDAFVRNITKILVKLLISNDTGYQSVSKKMHLCLSVIQETHSTIYTNVVSNIIKNSMRTVDDSKLQTVALLIRTNKKVWIKLDNHDREKIKNIVAAKLDKIEDIEKGFIYISQFDLPEFNTLKNKLQADLYIKVDKQIHSLAQSGSYSSAESNGRSTLNLIEFISVQQFPLLIDAFINNKYGQIFGAAQTPEIWTEMFIRYPYNHLVKEEWKRLKKYIEEDGYERSSYQELLNSIEQL